MTKILSQQEFIGKCNLIHNGKYNYDGVNYVSQNQKITVGCQIHGLFTTLAGNHIRGHGCPKCANISRNNNVKLTHAAFINRLIERNKIHPIVQLSSENVYQTAKTKLWFYCEYGHEWQSLPNDVLKGHGCAKCAVQRREQTMLEKYDIKYVTQQSMSQDTKLHLNNANWLIDQHHSQEKSLSLISLEQGVSPKCVKAYINKHDIEHRLYPSSSQYETEIITHITTVYNKHINIETNNKTIITPYELDIVVHDYNFAIELDGIFWHGEHKTNRDRTYHKRKTKMCDTVGIQLLHIFENEWITKKEIVKSRINNLLGLSTKIYARDCIIVKLTSDKAREFLDQNHIQGFASGSVYIGLEYDGDLVACCVYGKPRMNKQAQYELIRLCNAINSVVVGGASKLHSFFVKNHLPTSIVSYCDLRYGTGNVYKKLGYLPIGYSDPNYFYFKQSDTLKLYSRHQFQKHKLQTKLDNFDPKLSEWDNMKNNGYDRIWDCGNSVWIWKAQS